MSETFHAGPTGPNYRLIGICAGLIALIVVVLVMGRPRPKPKIQVHYGYHGLPDFNVDPDAGDRELNALVKRTKGDYSLLTADERTWIEALTANHGMEVLYKRAQIAAKREAAAARHKHASAAGAARGTPATSSNAHNSLERQ